MYIEIFQASISAVLLLMHSLLNGLAVIAMLAPVSGNTGFSPNRYLVCFFGATIGLVVNMLALFAYGIAGWLSPMALLLGAIVLSLVAGGILRRKPAYLLSAISPWKYTDGLLLLALLLVTVISAAHAPGHWDDTMYHLPLARHYLEQEAIVVNEYLRFPLFPQHGNLLVMLGLMLGGELGAQLFATIPLFLICVGLLGASLWQTRSLIVGLIAIYFLYRLGPVRSTLGYAYIDNTVALFCWGAVLALAISMSSKALGWVLVSGFLAGAAAGSKYFGLVLAGLAGLYLLATKRNVKMLIAFAAAAMFAGIWWYIRSLVVSGDPLHPAGGNIFGHYLWNATDLEEQTSEQATHGVSPESLNILAALDEARAEVFVLGLVSLLVFTLPPALKPMRILFFFYLLFWFFVTQVDRYLSPVYGVGVFLAAYLLYWAVWRGGISRYFSRRGRLAGQVLAASVAMISVAGLFSRPLKQTEWTREDWQRELESQSGYHLLSQSNKLIDAHGDRMIQIGFENAVYYFDGTIIGDWFGPGRYRQFFVGGTPRRPLLPPEQMREVMDRFGASILAVPKKRFVKFDRAAYLQHFDISVEDEYGLVLTQKRR